MPNYRRHLTYTIVACLACTPPPQQAPPRIVLDGAFDDWDGVPLLTTAESTPDGWARLWASNDEFSLLIRIEVQEEISLQADNTLELCLDTDSDGLTGEALGGFGAEMCWAFGDRRGRFVTGDSATPTPLAHQDIGLISAPTVTGRHFEIALARDAAVDGHPLFGEETVGLLLRDTESGQRQPASGGYEYRFVPLGPAPLQVIPLARQSANHVRFLSYNLNNHLTEAPRAAALRRVLLAVDPDVILLQEIRSTPTQEAAQYVFDLLGSPREGWHVAKVGGERSVVLSPYPILRADSLGESGAVLLDVGGGSGGSEGRFLLVIVLSAPCCNAYEQRAREMDRIISYVRDARTAGGNVDIPHGTPILLMGDANFVGLESDRRTLTHGEIVDRDTYGEPFLPDWDDTPFADLVPRHTHRPYTFTWHGDDFPPGRLDYVLYGDSRLQIGNRFVLFTPDLPLDVLQRYGLEAEDTNIVTDHLPLVADLIVDVPRAP